MHEEMASMPAVCVACNNKGSIIMPKEINTLVVEIHQSALNTLANDTPAHELDLNFYPIQCFKYITRCQVQFIKNNPVASSHGIHKHTCRNHNETIAPIIANVLQ